MRHAIFIAGLLATLASTGGGCSTSGGGTGPSLAAAVPGYTGKKVSANHDSSTEGLNFTTLPGPNSPGGEGPGYTMSAEELDYDCKKLTGKMQVRILDIRGYDTREKTTTASRALHGATKMVVGGTNTGLNTDVQYAKDKAMLEAYNKQLVAKDCKSYNIAEALAGTGVPSPTIEAPSKAKKPAKP